MHTAHFAATPLCLAGVETEYAMTALARGGRALPAQDLNDAVMAWLTRTHATLPSSLDPGFHLPCGGKLYREPGEAHDFSHLEFSTPECTHPVELVRHVEGGHQLLLRAAEALPQAVPHVQSAHVYRHSVCHVQKTSWAVHLSVLTSSRLPALATHLVPHLVTKHIYSGTGGFPLQGDFTFCLAPRMSTFTALMNPETTQHRPLLNTREMPYGTQPLRRQHLIGFEGPCSHLARYLDIGSTLLIMKGIDAGDQPGQAVALADPIAALHAFLGDVTCRQTAPRAGGGQLSAIEIQRHYLERVTHQLHREFMPDWAGEFCTRWSQILTLIEDGAPDSVCDRLDWPLKHQMMRRYLSANGSSMPSCRDELLELDIRFGELRNGIFDQLDAAGMLKHRVPGVEPFAEAVLTPPSDTRAKPRGEAIATMHRAGHVGSAHWDSVENQTTGERLDLGDPFELAPVWKR